MENLTEEEIVNKHDIKECLKQQLLDIETLQSIYMEPGEFEISDHGVYADVNEFVQCTSEIIPNRLDFSLNLSNNGVKTEINFNLPNTFPYSKPDIYVVCSKLTRTQSKTLNDDLRNYVNETKDPYCLFAITDWIKEAVDKYSQNEVKENVTKIVKEYKYCRYWIYSHHIYNKLKRREILSLAHELNLSGFCMPGKPGVICIEGVERNCDEWWSSIKSMNWQKINVINREDLGDYEKERFFHNFEEKIFQKSAKGNNEKHMDMGEFFKFLEQNGCGYMFKYYFGFDGTK